MQNLVIVDTLAALPVQKDATAHPEQLIDKRRTSAFQREVDVYLERHPQTQHVDLLLSDLNGCFRGKRIPIAGLHELSNGCYFPSSIFAINLYGNTVDIAGLGQDKGEPDHICMPIAGTLSPSAADPGATAQLLLTMLDEDGSPFDVEPRNVLVRLWQTLRSRGLYAQAAVELEFYLVNRERSPQGSLQTPCMPGMDYRHSRCQVYSLDNLDMFGSILKDIDRLAALQGLPTSGAVAESSPGQFEINLCHSDVLPVVCDQALQLKRLVRMVAESHAMNATFMAKPYGDMAGSGMHIHFSLHDAQGNNVLSDGCGRHSGLMCDVLAGMLDLMPASMALLAPNVNAFRRFQPDKYVPVRANWGYNNRTVALRIPRSDCQNHRVEYRVAGADANPYLVMAAMIAGVLHGLDNKPSLPAEICGNGGEERYGPLLPNRQSEALWHFKQDTRLSRLLGDRFCRVYHACKHAELRHFEQLVTETEINWLLSNA